MNGFFNTTELALVAPTSLIPKCGACGLYKTCESPKMEPSGKGRKKVLIVAEAPGREEDEKGIQLVGKSGRYLQQVLDRIGVDMRKDCWLTNAIICRPPGNEIKDGKTVDYCRPNLIKTIDELQPDKIILLGGIAIRSLIASVWSPDIGKTARWVGWNIPCQKLNAWVFPTWHPSYLLREDNAILHNYFDRHLRQAFQTNNGHPFEVVPDYQADVRLMFSAEEVAGVLDQITSGTIAFDYENNMLKPDSELATGISCSVCWNGIDTIAFPLHGKTIPALRRLLQDRNVKKVAHNMKYEDRWTKRILGVQVRNWYWDSMVAAHLIDCRPNITGLKFLSFVHLGQQRYDAHVEPFLKSVEDGGNAVNRIKEVPLEKLLTYNGLDSLLTYKIAKKQMKEMEVGEID